MQEFQQQAALQQPQPPQAIAGPNQTLNQGQFTNQQPQKDYSSVMVTRQSQMNLLRQVDQRVNCPNVVLGSIVQMNAITSQTVASTVQVIKRGAPVSPQEQQLLDAYPKIAPFHMEVIMGWRKTLALIETGAQCTVMSAKFPKETLGPDYTEYPRILNVTVAKGKTVKAHKDIQFRMDTLCEQFQVSVPVVSPNQVYLPSGTDILFKDKLWDKTLGKIPWNFIPKLQCQMGRQDP
uniref:Peptidase A2 domain-containing protein n=1 Tax=Romanomermis culicivorax TaxID=13658 RepID=A0A915KND9_ROMCU